MYAGQRSARSDSILWKATLTSAAKGTRIPLPKEILRQVKARPDDCMNPSPEELAKPDAYQKKTGGVGLIAVWSESSCYCSPTGNCAFWIFRLKDGKYSQLLRADMVREFGFVPSESSGLPDVVLWSHDSAMRFPGNLWQFDGKNYVSKCGWEIVTTYEDLPNGGVKEIGSHVEKNSCSAKLVPESEPVAVE